jgi:predicted nucleotidyltransferase
MDIPYRVREAAREHPYPLLFATISGAHLYGFPSADSDWDLRGCHILPATELLGLEEPRETIEVDEKGPEIELDLVTHDAGKFFRMLLKNNGYVLEQLYSPLVLRGGDKHEELKTIAKDCITKHHVHHYRGFYRGQWKRFAGESPPRVKPLLYTYRVLLTGIHLMQTGRVEANLVTLNDEYAIPGVDELIACKREGQEKETLDPSAVGLHESAIKALGKRLEKASAKSRLPAQPQARAALSDFLVRLRSPSEA